MNKRFSNNIVETLFFNNTEVEFISSYNNAF